MTVDLPGRAERLEALVADLDGLDARELEELRTAVEDELGFRDAENLNTRVEVPEGKRRREGLHRCGCGRVYQHVPDTPVGGVWYVFLSAHGQSLHESGKCACGAALPPAANRGGASLF